MSLLDISLQNSYKSLVNLTSLNNYGNSLLLNNTTSILSNLYIKNNSYINNNISINSNLNVSGSAIISFLTINSNLYILKNHYCSNLSTNNINISGNTIINNISLMANLNISGNTTIVGNVTINSNLTIGSNLIVPNLTLFANIVGFNGNFNNLYNINNLYISNNSNMYNGTILSNLNITNNSFLGNTIINSNININNNTNIIGNTTVLSLLYVSSNTTINSNSTITSSFNNLGNTYVNNNCNINKNLLNNGNTIINSNLTILSILYISSNTNIKNNLTIQSIFYVSGSTNINKNLTINSSLYISGSTNINGTTNINNRATFNSNLNISGTTNLVNINIGGYIINNLPEYTYNTDAVNAGITLWSFYRTGGILKIRTDIIAPVITLLGDNPFNLSKYSYYVDPGVTVTDNLGETILPIITNNIINTQNGTYLVTYTATDSYGNTSSLTRTVNVTNTLTGFAFIIYNNYFNDNFYYNTTAALYNSTSYGVSSDMTNLSTSTKNIIGDGNYVTCTIYYTGNFVAPITGTYTFWLSSDDGSYLFINNLSTPIINNGGEHIIKEMSCNISLIANTVYPILIIYGNSGGYGNIILSFTLPNSSTRIYNFTNYVYNNITAPTITLNGNNVIVIPLGGVYNEPGVVINTSFNVTLTAIITGTVNTNSIGKYIITYTTTDPANNTTSINRIVYVLNFMNYTSYNLTNTYLYKSNNYNLLTTTNYWTIECWINITSYSSSYSYLVDFNQVPWITNTGFISLIINNNGILGIYNGFTNTYTYSGTIGVQLNVWTHIVYQRNSQVIELYINGSLVGNIYTNINYNYPNIQNLNQITIGNGTNSLNNSNYNLKGIISQLKITPSKLYNIGFIPNGDLTPTLSNTLFFLGNNYTDTITNTILTYNTLPNIIQRQFLINLIATAITPTNLVFNLLVSNLPSTNTTWTDSTGNYNFIVHTNANNFNSIIKVQNNNGWKRTGYVAWVMNALSYNNLINTNWLLGLTLEQWIFIDNSFIPSSDNMLLVGQSSILSSNGYGFGFITSNYNSTSYPFNVLSFMTSVALTNQGTGAGAININKLRNTWTHLAFTSSTSSKSSSVLNLYINGALIISLNNSQFSAYPNPSGTGLNFAIGANSNSGYIQSNTLSSLHFGNTRMYNRILDQKEIINNYMVELPNYITPTNDIYINISPPTIASNTLTNYNLSNGYLTQNIDLNELITASSWTIESWIYSTSWGNTVTSGSWLLDLSNGGNYLSFGITQDITNISSSITNDGNGRPFIYYSMDTISKWKINSNIIVPLNQWVHIVYQKNNSTTLEMFVNGISGGKWTVNFSDWNFPNFGTQSFNKLLLGQSINSPSSLFTQWNGKISQCKISIENIYTSPFTPAFDLSINNYGLFLLNNNFINPILNKLMTINNTVTIPSYYGPIININGLSTYNLVTLQPYTDLGYTYDYYTRTNLLTFNTINNFNTNLPGNYTIIYTITDYLNSISFATRNINVIINTSPPVITLKTGKSIIITNGSTFIDPGYTITDLTGLPIIPIITGTVNTNINGIYYITYSATNILNLTTTVTRTVTIVSFSGFNVELVPTFTITQFRNWSTPFQNNTGGWSRIAFANNIYIIFDCDLTTYFISTDTINWTKMTTFYNWNGNRADVDRLTGCNTFFAAAITPYVAPYRNKLYISNDGINWTEGPSSIFNNVVTDIQYIQNYVFVKVQNGGMYKSSDGINWTLCTIYLNGTNVSANFTNGNILYYRPEIPISYIAEMGLCYNYDNNMYVAAIRGRGYGPYIATVFILTSIDNGNTWTSFQTDLSIGIRDITYGNGIYIIAGDPWYYQYHYSTNLTTWTTYTYNLNPRNFLQILYGNNKFIMIVGRIGLYYSYDAINWTYDTNFGNNPIIPTLTNNVLNNWSNGLYPGVNDMGWLPYGGFYFIQNKILVPVNCGGALNGAIAALTIPGTTNITTLLILS